MNPPDRRTSTHTSDTRFLRHVLACALAQYRRESRGHPRPRVTCVTFPALLIFTRELAFALRRDGYPRGVRTIVDRKSNIVDSSGPLSPHAQQLAARWFNRGLSGRVLWLIAEQLLRRGSE